MKFRFLLWALGFLMKRAQRKSEEFRKSLEGQDITFQITSQDGVARQYTVANQAVTTRSGKVSEPAFELSFKDAGTGFTIMTAKEAELAFMKGIQDKDITITGDYTKLMWFQEAMKYAKPEKKKAA